MKQSRNLNSGQFSDEVRSAIRSDYNLVALPRLIADWNMQQYGVKVTADNIPSDQEAGYDIEMFPIETIAQPQRPTKGINKAIVGQAVASAGYQSPDSAKFYVADEEDIYKYWTSPTATRNDRTFATPPKPHVAYNKMVKANKIVVKVENTWATPDDFSLYVRYSYSATAAPDKNWSRIGQGAQFDNKTGTLTLYWNGSGWVSTRPATLVETNIAGIMLEVRSMRGGYKKDGSATRYTSRTKRSDGTFGPRVWNTTDGSKSNLNLIAIEPHLEVDMTDRLISVEDTFDFSESSQLYPIGTITTNTATLVLSNDDQTFNNENTNSPYYGLLEPNVEFNLEYIYDINGVKHSVQQFHMYSNLWTGQQGPEVNVELEDYSKFLKVVKPNPTLIVNKSVTEIIWRVLDSVGFNDYVIDLQDRVIEHEIPYFWTDGEKTAWEVLDEIAQATQTAIYFDEYGQLQVKTREAAYRELDSPTWRLYGQDESNILADIVELNQVEEYEANKIDVTYKATKWKVTRTGAPALTRVWTPENENVVVRSSALVRSIGPDSANMWVSQQDVKLWPFAGKVNIEGEVIEYDAKQFVYHTANGTPTTVMVKDSDEMKKYNQKTPSDNRGSNYLTGALRIKERGVWNTEKRNHSVDLNYWNPYLETINNGTMITNEGPRGWSLNKARSTAEINTPGEMKDNNDTFFVTRGQSAATGYKMFGTKFKFTGSGTTQRAGFGFNVNGGRRNGYYVEFALTASMTAESRKHRNEVSLFSRTGGEWKVLDGGQPIAIGKNLFYEVDAYLDNSGAQDVISVYVNGRKVITATTTAATKNPWGGQVALYARGKSNIEYEYFYAVAKNIKTPPDDFSFYDLKYGGMRGGMFEREVVWQMKSRWKKIKKKKWKKIGDRRQNEYLFDEFGPYVHEVREFSASLDPAPVQYASILSTNEQYATVLEFYSSPFDAHFIIANTGRDNAILHGEDALTLGGTDKIINQQLGVLGRNLEISDDETVTRKNELAIRQRGLIDTELTSDWIQSKSMALDVAKWIAKHWSEGVDELNVEIFGNPLIELGDIIDISYIERSMTPATHKYFVVGTSNSFESGVTTNLTLRRVRATADELLS